MCCPESFWSFLLQGLAASLSTVLCNLCAELLQLLRCQVGSKLSYNAIVALKKVEIRQFGHSYFFAHGLQTVYSSIDLQNCTSPKLPSSVDSSRLVNFSTIRFCASAEANSPIRRSHDGSCAPGSVVSGADTCTHDTTGRSSLPPPKYFLPWQAVSSL